MRSFTALLALALLTGSLALLTGSWGHASPPAAAAQASGGHLFKTYCARCHGAQARGDGPAAHALNTAVPDLTRIAHRNGGEFPAERIYRIIDGQSQIPAHGGRAMPLWGYDFFGTEADDESAHREASLKIEALVAYLASIQRR